MRLPSRISFARPFAAASAAAKVSLPSYTSALCRTSLGAARAQRKLFTGAFGESLTQALEKTQVLAAESATHATSWTARKRTRPSIFSHPQLASFVAEKIAQESHSLGQVLVTSDAPSPEVCHALHKKVFLESSSRPHAHVFTAPAARNCLVLQRELSAYQQYSNVHVFRASPRHPAAIAHYLRQIKIVSQPWRSEGDQSTPGSMLVFVNTLDDARKSLAIFFQSIALRSHVFSFGRFQMYLVVPLDFMDVFAENSRSTRFRIFSQLLCSAENVGSVKPHSYSFPGFALLKIKPLPDAIRHDFYFKLKFIIEKISTKLNDSLKDALIMLDPSRMDLLLKHIKLVYGDHFLENSLEKKINELDSFEIIQICDAFFTWPLRGMFHDLAFLGDFAADSCLLERSNSSSSSKDTATSTQPLA